MRLNINNNIVNDGIYYGDSEYIAYNFDKSLIIENLSTNANVKLNYNAFFLNRVGDYFIFTPKDYGFCLFLFNIQTHNIIRLTEDSVRWCVSRKNRWIYYTKGDCNCVFEFDTQLWIERIIIQQDCNYLTLINDSLFFSNWSDGKSLYKYNIETKVLKQVLNLDIAWINIVNNDTFIIRCWHNRKTYLFDLENKRINLLNVDSANYICYHNGYIYYSNIKYGGIWQQSIVDKQNKKKLYDDAGRRINIVSDDIICFQNKDKQTVFLKHDEKQKSQR